ncbi:MAG: hypothetical protein WC069_01350 [Candidatus Shapirobacteria bacterium]
MKLLDNYTEALKDITNYLQNDLAELEITAAQIYGSSTWEKGFIPGISDIDICVYTDKFNILPPEEIISIIKKKDNNYTDKFPTILRDHIANRIEFYISHPKIKFDITILPPEFPNGKNIINTTSYDSFEMLVGTLYQHGIPLFGEIPDKQYVDDNYLPFYSDEIRTKRLKVLTNRILIYSKRVDLLQKNKDPDIIDHLYKTRTHFLKWLYIYLRKYPVSLYKHINYQLSDILCLSQDEKNALLFLGKGDLFKLASNYLQISNKYLDRYQSENI